MLRVSEATLGFSTSLAQYGLEKSVHVLEICNDVLEVAKARVALVARMKIDTARHALPHHPLEERAALQVEHKAAGARHWHAMEGHPGGAGALELLVEVAPALPHER